MNSDEKRFRIAMLCRTVILPIVVAAVAYSSSAQERSAVPSSDTQAAVSKVLAETYELSRLDTTAKKQAATKKLLQVASDSNLSAAERYVVLTTVIGLARDSGDFTTWSDAVDSLFDGFDVDTHAERIRLFTEFLITSKSAAVLKLAVEECIAIAQRKAESNQYAQATSLLNAANAAIKSNTAATSLLKRIAEAKDLVTAREKEWKEFQLARKKLETSSDDATANFTVGRWHVLRDDDWDIALPFLAKASDPKWRNAAKCEEAKPTEAAAQAAAGDAWWDAGEKETGTAKTALRMRAGKWYELARPNLSPLTQQLTEKRLEEIASMNAIVQPELPNQSIPKKIAPTPNDVSELAIGQWIDLLAMVKLPGHVLLGKWRRNDEALICEPSGDARFIVPVSIRGSYELTCDFTRRTNEDCVGVIFPVGQSPCVIFLSGWGGRVSGLQMVDGRPGIDIAESTGAVVRPGPLVNGQKYRLHVKVTQEGQQATVAATLDKKRIVAWTGKLSQLSISPGHMLPCSQSVSLFANDVIADFHKFELRLKSGAKAYRFADDWHTPLNRVNDIPPKEVATKCLEWRGRKYFISDKPMNLSAAQALANQLNGRLLTISSADEEAFILGQGRGLTIWMAGWRQTDTQDWRDERHRPLRFYGAWGPNAKGKGGVGSGGFSSMTTLGLRSFANTIRCAMSM